MHALLNALSSLRSGAPRDLLALAVAVVFLACAAAGCRGEREEAVLALPECTKACVVQVRDSPLLEIRGDDYRVWALRDRTVDRVVAVKADPPAAIEALRAEDKAAEMRGLKARTVAALCHADTPGAKLRDVLKAAGEDTRAVMLAGRQGDTSARNAVGFVALRVWGAEALDADVKAGRALRVAPNPKGEGLSFSGVDPASKTPVAHTGEAPKCPKGVGAVCPVLVFDPADWSCGALVRHADALARSGDRLMGLAR